MDTETLYRQSHWATRPDFEAQPSPPGVLGRAADLHWVLDRVWTDSFVCLVWTRVSLEAFAARVEAVTEDGEDLLRPEAGELALDPLPEWWMDRYVEARRFCIASHRHAADAGLIGVSARLTHLAESTISEIEATHRAWVRIARAQLRLLGPIWLNAPETLPLPKKDEAKTRYKDALRQVLTRPGRDGEPPARIANLPDAEAGIGKYVATVKKSVRECARHINTEHEHEIRQQNADDTYSENLSSLLKHEYREDATQTASNEMLRKLLREHVQGRLNERDAEIVALDFLGYDSTEIGARLDIRPGTVRVYIHRAREKLRA